MSAYAAEIGSVLADNARNKDEAVRTLAVEGTALLATRCSNSEAVEATFDKFHSMLVNKAEKVTQSDCRITVYRGLAALGKAPLAGSAKTDFAFGSIKKLLDTHSKESVESTLLAGAAAIASLAATCGSKAHSAELVKAATETLGNAKATVPVKSAMLECLLASFSGDHAVDAVPVCPSVVKAFRSAQVPISTSVKHLAATFLLRVANAAPEAAAQATDAKFGAKLLDDRASADKFFRLVIVDRIYASCCDLSAAANNTALTPTMCT